MNNKTEEVVEVSESFKEFLKKILIEDEFNYYDPNENIDDLLYAAVLKYGKSDVE